VTASHIQNPSKKRKTQQSTLLHHALWRCTRQQEGSQAARQPEPKVRGSFSILSTSLLTLGFCVWTSVHLSIPEENLSPKRKKWDVRGWITHQQWRKIGWLILGLLAPEMITFTAWSQRSKAKVLTEKVQHFLQNRLERPGNGDDLELNDLQNRLQRARPWTDFHSFYVISGGFVFSTYDLPPEEKFLPRGRNRVVLSDGAVVWLAENELSLLPDLSKAEIDDRSKANHLAKTIICVQAIWFIAQCASRMAQGLAISLLELSTFAHTLCRLLIYNFWWHKPLDIEEPTHIKGEKMHSLCAMLCFRSEFDGVRDSDYFSLRNDYGGSEVPNLLNPEENSNVPGVIYPGQSTANIQFDKPKPRVIKPRSGVLHISRLAIHYSTKDERRWNLASGLKPYVHLLDRGSTPGV
jgi:hypothetical protein